MYVTAPRHVATEGDRERLQQPLHAVQASQASQQHPCFQGKGGQVSGHSPMQRQMHTAQATPARRKREAAVLGEEHTG